MSATVLDMSMSLDGYVTGPNDSRENPFGDGAEMLHDWIFDAATDDDRAILQATLDGVGAIVMGRTSFDKNEGEGGWGDAGPMGEIPCFVVTHNQPTASHPAVFTFITDGVVSAIDQAKDAQATRSSACSARRSCNRPSRSASSTRSACTSTRCSSEAAPRCSARSTRRSSSNASKRESPRPRHISRSA